MLSNAFAWWAEYGDFGFLPLVALLLVLDALTGFSRRWAAAHGMAPGDDRALLAFVIVPGILFWGIQQAMNIDITHFYGTYIFSPHFGYRHPSDAGYRGGINWFRWNLVSVIVTVSTVACPMIAWFKWRSVPQWLALGFLGGAGAIIWLLLTPRDQTSVMRPVKAS